MDFFDVLARRRSIRRYKATPVEKEKLLAVLEAARLAPTWENKQGWRLIVTTTPEQKEKLLAAIPDANLGKKGITSAPVAMVLCAHPGHSGEREGQKYYLVDCGIVFDHLVLAACAQGLGTCWIGAFGEDRIEQDFGIPEPWRVVALTPWRPGKGSFSKSGPILSRACHRTGMPLSFRCFPCPENQGRACILKGFRPDWLCPGRFPAGRTAGHQPG